LQEITMNPVEPKDVNDVSGGFSPDEDCFPKLPFPEYPVGPWPEPVVGANDPQPFSGIK
jgi:hypothetical protein